MSHALWSCVPCIHTHIGLTWITTLQLNYITSCDRPVIFVYMLLRGFVNCQYMLSSLTSRATWLNGFQNRIIIIINNTPVSPGQHVLWTFWLELLRGMTYKTYRHTHTRRKKRKRKTWISFSNGLLDPKSRPCRYMLSRRLFYLTLTMKRRCTHVCSTYTVLGTPGMLSPMIHFYYKQANRNGQ